MQQELFFFCFGRKRHIIPQIFSFVSKFCDSYNMHFANCFLQLYGIKMRLPIGRLDDKMKEKQNLIEVFKQKARNRFKKITNVAILKVRKAYFDGFDEEKFLYIQTQHKRLLTISKEFNSSQEVGILIDIITWDDWVIMGHGNKIEIKDNFDAYKRLKENRTHTLLFMHNRPSTSTFSGEDFKTFCDNDSLYIMTVVGNDGSVQTLTKTAGFDKENALLYYQYLAMEKYSDKVNNGTLAMKELLKNANTIGLEYRRGGDK